MQQTILACLRWALAGVAALAAALVFKHWVSRRLRSRDAVQHAARLADDIGAVADTIEADLVRLKGSASWAALDARCNECRERADQASAQRRLIVRLEPDALQDLVEHLHEDHRRVVNLRSEVDLALAASRGSRIYSFSRSRYPSSSFPTRPSTLI